ncbi:MAG: MMPL family transporter [Candidatus Bathyarchaeota archaeon]|nr:MMPL family transporter [Candidatus Bathyarchaeota archaeon]
MANHKVNLFGKLGRVITKRKFSIIAVWLLLLAIVLPIVLTASGVSSLTMNSSTDNSIESAKANDIIKTQFQKSVSNDSLIIVISTSDASSLSTQDFIDELTRQINESSTIKGVENITSVYSILIPALNQTNQALYLAYDGGNLTYSLLYSVPTIYSNVWYQAYNTTKASQLMPGLNQTNQGVYSVYDNANMTYYMLYSVPATYSGIWAGAYTALENANLTYNLLYSIPAIYLNAWQQAMTSTLGNVDQSNVIANQTTAQMLYAADPAAYAQYTSHLLQAFHGAWTQSYLNPSTAAWTPLERATFASDQTNQLYINTFLAGDVTAQAFTNALANTLTLQDYLTNTQTENNIALTDFIIQILNSMSSGSGMSLSDIQAAPAASYSLDPYTIAAFNTVAYSQTAALLSQADPAAYTEYLAPLLYGFNATWAMSFQNPATQTFTSTDRASLAANITVQNYISTALAGNATMQGFVKALTQTFSLNSFLTNTAQQNNEQLRSFAIEYVANQSNTAKSFVAAAFNLGRAPSSSALAALADNVIWYSPNYGLDSFISLFNGISYNQTRSILKDIDESAYTDYTSHLLDMFNASWSQRVPSQPTASWINQTASAASNAINGKFIDTYLSDGADFSKQIAASLTLQDFLNANSTYTNAKIETLTLDYVANESGLSRQLISAVYNMGENASESALKTLASSVISDPDAYNLGEEFNTLLTSFVSPNNDVTLVSVTFDGSHDGNLLAIRGIIADLLAQNPSDIQDAQVTGADALNYDFMQSTFQDLELILPVTIALLVIATALFFRSIVTPIITLGTIGIGLGVSQIFPYLVGTYINQVDYTVNTILLTVLIGVGTDYSIFVLARHREERINGLPLFEAIKKSITWAGESIVTSGATVIISFLALSATSMIFLQTMGLIVGCGVIVTLLASLTFAPALAAILGDRIFWPNSGERFARYAAGITEKNQRRGGYFARSGSFSVKHGKVIILLAVLVTVPAFYVYASTTPTYDMIGSASSSLESISASTTLTDSFGGGRMLPTYAVVTFSSPIVTNGSFNMGEMATLQAITESITGDDGLQEVTGPTMPFGDPVDYQTITNQSDSTTYNAMLSAIGDDNQSALITIKFNVDPYSTEAMDYAKEIRSSLHANFDDAANVTGIYLGGTTGETLDMRNTFENQFAQILPIVALGVGIVLFIVLGSLILPVFAILSVLMSIVWTLAVTVVVFQAAFGYGLLFITPLILFVLLLGLGMDYNIFILTRIREEASKGQHLNDAIVHAIQQTGGIITAAAIILAGSLGAMMLSSNMMLREMGFAFAFSILIDALVVRTYIVPAVMATFGKWNWYNPIKRLQRIKGLDGNGKTSVSTEQNGGETKTQ